MTTAERLWHWESHTRICKATNKRQSHNNFVDAQRSKDIQVELKRDYNDSRKRRGDNVLGGAEW